MASNCRLRLFCLVLAFAAVLDVSMCSQCSNIVIPATNNTFDISWWAGKQFSWNDPTGTLRYDITLCEPMKLPCVDNPPKTGIVPFCKAPNSAYNCLSEVFGAVTHVCLASSQSEPVFREYQMGADTGLSIRIGAGDRYAGNPNFVTEFQIICDTTYTSAPNITYITPPRSFQLSIVTMRHVTGCPLHA